MTHIERSALLPYSAEKLFDLVNDVESYPEYMDGCASAEILNENAQQMDARLSLKKGGLSFSFVTRNELARPESITMKLVEGPFDSLNGTWTFAALASDACKVKLELTFKLASSAASKAAEKVFESVAANQVNALCHRANLKFGV